MSHPIIWTEEKAIAALRALRDRLGREPRQADVRTPGSGCPWDVAFTRLFGSFRGYQLAAGFKSTRPGRARAARCRSGRHAMNGRNVVIEYAPRKTDPTKFIAKRRCRLCRKARLSSRPTTVAEREAIRRAALAKKAAAAAKAKGLAQNVRAHWVTNPVRVTVIRQVSA